MTKPFVSLPKANRFGAGIFLLSLAALAGFDFWWPGIMLAIGLALVVRQALLNQWYDAFLSLVIFGGVFVTVWYKLSWTPVLFVLGGLYLLFKAFLHEEPPEIEEEEEIQKELEEHEDGKD